MSYLSITKKPFLQYIREEREQFVQQRQKEGIDPTGTKIYKARDRTHIVHPNGKISTAKRVDLNEGIKFPTHLELLTNNPSYAKINKLIEKALNNKPIPHKQEQNPTIQKPQEKQEISSQMPSSPHGVLDSIKTSEKTRPLYIKAFETMKEGGYELKVEFVAHVPGSRVFSYFNPFTGIISIDESLNPKEMREAILFELENASCIGNMADALMTEDWQSKMQEIENANREKIGLSSTGSELSQRMEMHRHGYNS